MIESYAFGRIRVAGRDYTDDIKIVDGRVLPGWWRTRGHTVLPADVDDLLAARPEVLVLGRGRPGLMRSSPELRELLERLGIRLVEEKTSQAVAAFNTLFRQGTRVAAGLHISC